MNRDRAFVLLQRVLPKTLISALVGRLTRLRGGVVTTLAIRLFVRAYGVDLEDAAIRDVTRFETFNAFFTRALSDGARPQPAQADAVACPADGTISEQGAITRDSVLQAKGVAYALCDLFDGDAELAARFDGGSFQTVYLAPHNYHRVHVPLDGRACALRYMPGALYSVNAATTRALPGLFCANERVAVVFERDDGCFALVMVGALNVGSIELTVPLADTPPGPFRNRPQASLLAGHTHLLDGPPLARGAEFGRFNMGSSVIFLAGAGLLAWHDGLGAGSRVEVGENVGRVLRP